ncbi:MAG: hypothetical protein JW837_02400 [Sedimentisphaerales bacterium]|nr:hypothetical protein [Sedimentisphaerales bacterium]
MCRKFILLTSCVLVFALVNTASSQPTGNILFEYWLDIDGTAVADLTGAAGYPDSPDDFEWRSALDGPVDWADNYGARARGYLYPPADGDYTFWISGDDYQELYLSTDDNPANAALIAEVPGWTGHLEWGKYPAQQSAPVTLVGGQKYYIDSLMKEGGGGDSMAVAWAGPEIGEQATVIAGAYLSPWLIFNARKPVPADGSVDVMEFALEWTPGDTAVTSNVYLSTDDVIDANDLVAETNLAIVLPALDLGTTYYWKVDSVDAEGNVIEGPVWSFATIPLEAHFPSPADQSEWQPLDSKLSWTAGKDAIMHDVYLDVNEALVAAADPSTFKGKLMTTSFNPGPLAPDTIYYWKVNEFALGVTNPGPVWSFRTLDPELAQDPMPANGAEGVSDRVSLSWMASDQAVMHDVYLGTDANAVEAGDASVYMGTVEEPMLALEAALDWNTTYYWKVDVVTADEKAHPARGVWSFKVADYLIIEDAEMTLEYDNTVDPFVSELALDTPADLTINGIRNLSIMFRGAAAPEPSEGSASIDPNTGIFTVTGSGADIWGSSDQFHFGYRQLTGDGEIVARVLSNGEGSNTWAKGGVMIRETLAPNSKHMIMAMTGGDGGGIAFQGRPTTGGNSSGLHGDITASPPYWVKLTREGNTITAYASADGVTWDLFTDTSPDNSGGAMSNPIDVEMADPVYIGLFVTSHAAGELRTYEFDNVSIIGDISATNITTDIGLGEVGNAAAPIYAAIEDSTGAIATVVHPNPAATNIEQWWKWQIPLSEFAGVNLSSAAKLYLGAGDGELGGTGVVSFKEVRAVKPVVVKEAGGDITMPGDNVKGVPDDGDWPGAEYPALAVDNNVNTKFLHFKGETEPTGIKITPAAKQVVTGITFTTANDAPERDPIMFELYGSNDGIDGTYELIASGEIVDFNDPNEAWPRYTMNETPITFDNDKIYDHYQILFPMVRNAASANSMQIAEIELITDIPVLDNGDNLGVWNHDNSVDKWDGSAPGAGNPGGVAALTDDDVTYIRVQDTGDPRDYGSTIPTGKTNYSLYLTQPINNGLDGARIELRARIATTGTLDAWRKSGGGMASTGLFAWPAGGLGGSFENGTHGANYGRSNIGIAEDGKLISLALTTGGIEIGNSGNKVSVDNATAWNTYVINIAANGDGKYTVSVSANGKPDKSFTVTPGKGTVQGGNYIAVGSPDLAGTVATAFDVDYISVTK